MCVEAEGELYMKQRRRNSGMCMKACPPQELRNQGQRLKENNNKTYDD